MILPNPKVKAVGLTVGTIVIPPEVLPSLAARAVGAKLRIIGLGHGDPMVGSLAIASSATDHHDGSVTLTPICEETHRIGSTDVSVTTGVLEAIRIVVVIGEGDVAGAAHSIAGPGARTKVAKTRDLVTHALVAKAVPCGGHQGGMASTIAPCEAQFIGVEVDKGETHGVGIRGWRGGTAKGGASVVPKVGIFDPMGIVRI